MSKRKVILILLILALVMLLVSCILEKEDMDGDFPLSLIDDSGEEVVIDQRPGRIASLSKNNTEILFALGLDEEIVGVTEYCNYPEEARYREKVRDLESIDIEKIVELEVDLVVEYGRGGSQVRKELEERGIRVVSFAPETIEEVAQAIKGIARATGREEEGIKISKDILTRYENIKTGETSRKGYKVFYEEWPSPLMTAGKSTMIDYLIGEAGAINIGATLGKGYPEVDLADLVEKGPDLYMAKRENKVTKEDIGDREGFEKLKAVKSGRIILLDEDLVNVPGPRLIDGLEIICKGLDGI